MSGKRSARHRRVSFQQPAVLQMTESLEFRRLLTAASDEICDESLFGQTDATGGSSTVRPEADAAIEFEAEAEFSPVVISCELPVDFWRCGLPVPGVPIEPEVQPEIEPEIALEYVTCEIPEEISAEMTPEPGPEGVDESSAMFEVPEWIAGIREEQPVDAGLTEVDGSETEFAEYFVCGWPDGSFTDVTGSVPEECLRFEDKMFWTGDMDLVADPEQPEIWGEGFTEFTEGEPGGEAFVEDWPTLEEWNEPLILSDDSLLLMNSDLRPIPVMMLRTFAFDPAVRSIAAETAANIPDVAIRQRSLDSVFVQRAAPSTAFSDRNIDGRLIAVRSETRQAAIGTVVGRRQASAVSTTIGARRNIAEVLSSETSSEASELDVLSEPIRRQPQRPVRPVESEQPPIAPVSDTVTTNTQDAAVAELFVQGLPPQ